MEKTVKEIITRLEKDLDDLKSALASADTRGSSEREAYRPGPFEAVGDPESGWRYKWPPEGEESIYRTAQTFRDARGEQFLVGMAEPEEHYGRPREYAVVHELGRGGGLNALSVLTAADDYEGSGQLLGLISGKGPRGRQMFRPGDTLPPEYKKAEVVRFKDRVTGPYARDGLAVIVHRDKPELMLQHALIQRHLRS